MQTLNLPDELDPKTKQLVVDFAQALGEKLLASQRKYGYTDDWSRIGPDVLRRELMMHIPKGDPRDVAAFCAFLWYQGAGTV